MDHIYMRTAWHAAHLCAHWTLAVLHTSMLHGCRQGTSSMQEHLEEFLIDTLLHQLVTCFNHNLQKETIPQLCQP